MRYRPVAPDDLDTLVSRLARLAADTVLPWTFDPATGQFIVDVNGEKQPVVFGDGDVETQLVEAFTAGLPLLLEAVHKKYVVIDHERLRVGAKK